MAFSLGNFTIDEIIMAVAQSYDGDILYTLDQLSSAQIEISSDSNDVTDKRGNIVRTIYRTKQGTFTATNAFLHPQVLNAQSGSAMQIASASNALTMPKIALYNAGSTVTLDDGYVDGSIKVIGVYGNGGNSAALTAGTTADFDALTFGLNGKRVTLPAYTAATENTDETPVNYVIKYDREVTEGYKLVNDADAFAQTIQLTLHCAIVDPCSDKLRSAYVYIPSFQASPETTISLDAEEQELDFSGTLQTNYCGAQKNLYVIYFPDEDAVTTAISA